MRRPSSSLTTFYTRILPCVWLGFVLLYPTIIWLHPLRDRRPNRMFSRAPLQGIFGQALFWKLIWIPFAQVWLNDNWLLIKISRQQGAHVGLTDAINLNVTKMTRVRRITLMLRTESHFGRRVSRKPKATRDFINVSRHVRIAEALWQGGR